MPSRDDAAALFAEAVAIMARLRAPGGCPWDREQTFDSIRKYTLEETYEVLDAIERRNWPDLEEELGDLLLQVLFYAEMAAEPGYFDIAGVIASLNRKLVRRHPHVFGDEAAAAAGNVVPESMQIEGIDAPQVLRNWERIKEAEKSRDSSEKQARLGGIPRNLPALLEASKLGSKAAKSGFDWPTVQGLFDKLQEETEELQQELDDPAATNTTEGKEAVAGEVGDLLFTVANLARHLGVDPELALRGTNAKFRRRFGAMEAASVVPLEDLPPEQLEELWNRAKQAEPGRAASLLEKEK